MALIAHYPLNGDLLDYSGNGNHATNNSQANITVNNNGKIGKCYNFTGISYLSSIENVSLPILTYAAWIKWDSSATSHKGIINNFRHTGVNGYNISFCVASNGILRIDIPIKDGTSHIGFYATNVIPSGIWVHVAVSFNTVTGEYCFYVNGVVDKKGVISGASYIPVNVVPEKLMIGQWGWSYSTAYKYIGDINDVRIYDHTLSEKEIKEIAKAKILHYTFDDSSVDPNGGKIRDLSGYRNDATLASASAPTWVSDSKTGSGAYEFNGFQTIEKVINIPNNITMLVWFKSSVTGYGTYHIPLSIKGTNFEISVSSSGTLRTGYVISGTRRIVDTSANLLDNQWHLIGSTFDGSYIKSYKDGQLINSANYAGSLDTGTGGIGIGRFYGSASYGTIGYEDDIRIYATALSAEDILEIYETRASLDDHGNLYSNSLVVNGIGSVSNNKVAYHNWEEGDYSLASKTFLGDLPSHSMTFSKYANFTTKILQYGNPVGVTDRLLEYKVTTTHYAQYAHPTSYYYFTFDSTKTYRYSQWIYRHAEPSISYNQRCYLGIQGNTVCGLNTTTLNSNPYFAYPQMNESAYMDKWVLQVFYIYPYGSTGNPTGGKLYYVDGSSINTGISYNWADVSSSHIRQYPMYEYGEIAAGSYVLHYRPRLDVVDGTEPSIDDLISCGEHLPLIDNSYKKHALYDNGTIVLRGFSEVGITNGLVAYYPFDGNANDYSGNGNHGAVNGASISSGVKNQCYDFDGVDDYIITNNTLPYSNALTISAWFNKTGVGSTYECVLHHGIDSTIGSTDFWMGLSSTDYLTATIGGANLGWNAGQTTTLVELNKWYMLSATWDGSVVRVYIDGVYKKEYALTSITTRTVPIRIGSSTNGTAYLFNGKIDDVRIYNRALSPEEIAIQYDLTKENYTKMKITADTLYVSGQLKEV